MNEVTDLLRACANNNTKLASDLIISGSNPNQKDPNQSTSLHWACYRQNEILVKLLLQYNAIQTQDSNGIYPIHLAALVGNAAIVCILLTNTKINEQIRDQNGITPLHLAAFCGHNKVVTALCEFDPFHDISVKDNRSITPLHLASSCSLFSTVRLLLTRHADQSETDENGTLPLHWPAVNGNIPLLRTFLQWDDDLMYELDRNCNSYLQLATIYGHFETIIYLLQAGGHLDLVGGYKRSPDNNYLVLENLESFDSFLTRNFQQLGNLISTLHWSMAFCTTKVLKLFEDIGIDINGMENFIGINSLHLATSYGNLHMVKYIVESGAPLNLRDNWYQMTPLDCAVRNGHFEVVEYLIRAGATLNYFIDKERIRSTSKFWNARGIDSPLHYAARYDQPKIAKILIQHGANPNATGASACTPLCAAAGTDNLELVETLIKAGAYINPNCNNHPLIIAAQYNNREIVRYLLTNGAYAPNILHITTQNGSQQDLEYLFSLGIDINTLDKRGNNCLYYIPNRDHSHVEILYFLISHGADFNFKNEFGQTMLNSVILSNISVSDKIQMIQLLCCFGAKFDSQHQATVEILRSNIKLVETLALCGFKRLDDCSIYFDFKINDRFPLKLQELARIAFIQTYKGKGYFDFIKNCSLSPVVKKYAVFNLLYEK